MSTPALSEAVKNFIFEYVDSAESLEILLLISASKEKAWSTQELALELRSSPNSVANRIQVLKNLGLIVEHANGAEQYLFSPKDQATEDLVIELLQAYRMQRHRILELIFSPMKKARLFADAFRVVGPKDSGGSNGNKNG